MADAPFDGKCARCVGSRCCQYITEALGTPRSKADFDRMLWQVSHRDVEIYSCRDYDNAWREFDEPAGKHSSSISATTPSCWPTAASVSDAGMVDRTAAPRS